MIFHKILNIQTLIVKCTFCLFLFSITLIFANENDSRNIEFDFSTFEKYKQFDFGNHLFSENENKSAKKPKNKRKTIHAIYKKFQRDSLKITSRFNSKINKLEKYRLSQLANIEAGKSSMLIKEINKDNALLKSLVSELIGARKLLNSILKLFKIRLNTTPSDMIIEIGELHSSIEMYESDYKEMNPIGKTILNGIKGDSTYSPNVLYARNRAVELIMKYEHLYLQKKHEKYIQKLESSFNRKVLKFNKKNKRDDLNGTDDIVLLNIILDLKKIELLLKNYSEKLLQDFDSISPDYSFQRDEIIKSVNMHFNDSEKVINYITILENGIEGDSTLSYEVTSARFSALEILKEYDDLLIENDYLGKTIDLENKYDEKFRIIEEKSNYKLKKVHDDELLKIQEMKDRITQQILPLEKLARVIQDSLDIIAIRSLSGDEKLDSLVSYRNVLSNQADELSDKLFDYQSGISHDVYNNILILLHESERAFYNDSLSRAKERCLQAIDLDPKYSESYVRLGSIYYSNGEIDSAKATWEKALVLDASNEDLKKFMFLHGLH